MFVYDYLLFNPFTLFYLIFFLQYLLQTIISAIRTHHVCLKLLVNDYMFIKSGWEKVCFSLIGLMIKLYLTDFIPFEMRGVMVSKSAFLTCHQC